jgi:hypothetical protein
MAEWKFIEGNSYLKEYFGQFPIQLLELVKQVTKFSKIPSKSIYLKNFFFSKEKVAKFSGDAVVIYMNLLRNHLKSQESLFEVDTVQDFLETLNILGFRRGNVPERDETQLCYRFVNPNFKQSEVLDDFQPKLSAKALKGTKKMVTTHSIQLLTRLIRKKMRENLKISNLELARMRLNFALQKELDMQRNNHFIIESDFEEPDYVKKNEIAGYYGEVQIETLQNAFQSFFPVYSPPEEKVPNVPIVEEDLIVVDEPMMSKRILNDSQFPLALENLEITDCDEPKKKKFKYTRESRDMIRETKTALLNLEEEAMKMEE